MLKAISLFAILMAPITQISAEATPSPIPSHSDIFYQAERVASWQLKNFSYSTSGNLHDNGIAAWTHAVLHLGVTAWASIPGENTTKYEEWLLSIGTKSKWAMNGIYPYHADEFCIGQFFAAQYAKHADETMIQKTTERMDWVINTPPKSSSMTYTNKTVWSWCDALFMAPPLYASMSNLKKDKRYLDFMDREFKKTYNHLFDTSEKLFYRDDSYFGKKEANGKKVFWGRGNGWALAGIANILKALPKESELRPYYESIFRELALRLIQLQDSQGAWHASLLDPNSYPAPETSCTALITYALTYGVNSHLLTPEEALGAISKAWTTLCNAIHDNGKLGFVQPIGQDPKKVTKDMTATFGVGAFLMTAAELHKLCSLQECDVPSIHPEHIYNNTNTDISIYNLKGSLLTKGKGDYSAISLLASQCGLPYGIYIISLSHLNHKKTIKFNFKNQSSFCIR